MVVKDREFSLELNNQVTIQVLPSDFRSVRGFTAVCCIVDECAFLRYEGARTDDETLRALRPTLASTGGILIVLSTPRAKQGALYNAFKSYYGKESDVLVCQGSSLGFNPTLNREMIEKAHLEDYEGAKAEWDGLWRNDISSYCTPEAGEQCVIPNRYELPSLREHTYVAFVDPSGGSRDSMTLCVAHSEDVGRVVIDCIVERIPPFSPERVCAEFSDLKALRRQQRFRRPIRRRMAERAASKARHFL